MKTEKIGMAIRVVGTAVLRGLVVDRPAGVIVYGRDLDMREIRWLVDGMDATQETELPQGGPAGERIEIAGTILGRLYRLHLTLERVAELRGLVEPRGRKR